MKKYKDGVRVYNKPDKNHTRDFWLEEIRHKHYTYIQKDRKKEIPRRNKHKVNLNNGVNFYIVYKQVNSVII